MYNKSIKINFSKKKVIITGGSRGIGKKIAQDFKKLGARVISISTKNYDLSKSKDLIRLIKYIQSLNKIDILVNNGVKKVFSSYPLINSEITDQYLHRIPLNSFNNTKAKIWFNILRKSMKI